MRFLLSQRNVSITASFLITVYFVGAVASFAEGIKEDKFIKYAKSKLLRDEPNQKTHTPGTLVKKLKRRIKTTEGEQDQDDPQKRQVVNIESFFNQFSFLNFNRSSLFASSDSSSSSLPTVPTRFVINII